ncbi:MAG: hypothetical protein PHH82_02535 [Candidatus ainarchaeum sp.]|nr:hypothetical protein [Candidatus ainarchaeum sp.]
MPPEYLKSRGFLRGLEFSEHIAEHRNSFFRDRGLWGARRLRGWVEEQRERVNEVIHLMDKAKVRPFLDLLATAKIRNKAKFLERLKLFIMDDRTRALNRSEKVIDILASYGFSENGLNECLGEMALANKASGPALVESYEQTIDMLKYYKGAFKGDEAVYPLRMVRTIFAISGDPEAQRKICKKYFDLIFGSSNPKFCLQKGKNLFAILLRLVAEKRYSDIDGMFRNIKDLKTYVEITSKIDDATLQSDFAKISGYLLNARELTTF